MAGIELLSKEYHLPALEKAVDAFMHCTKCGKYKQLLPDDKNEIIIEEKPVCMYCGQKASIIVRRDSLHEGIKLIYSREGDQFANLEMIFGNGVLLIDKIYKYLLIKIF
jgi:hypothetical protein